MTTQKENKTKKERKVLGVLLGKDAKGEKRILKNEELEAF